VLLARFVAVFVLTYHGITFVYEYAVLPVRTRLRVARTAAAAKEEAAVAEARAQARQCRHLTH
jgi:hypothetical protein